jgi:hypothetical protein
MRPKIKSKQIKRDDKMQKHKPCRVPTGITPHHTTPPTRGTREPEPSRYIDPEGNTKT